MNRLKKVLFVFSLSALMSPVLSWADEVTVTGDATSALIYVLNGTGTTTMSIDDDDPEFPGLSVSQSFTFSMDSVASGNVNAQGAMSITGDDGSGEWNASFSADTIYKIKQYGDLISIQFNHALQSSSGTQTIVGETVESATISSKGSAVMQDDGSFSGIMSGRITAVGLDPWNYTVSFIQEFSDIEAQDLGDWTAILSYAVNGKKIIPVAEPSTISIGPAADPVDSVVVAIKGTYKEKTGLFSWAAAGTGADKKVAIKITATATEGAEDVSLVENKSQIAAAAQKRKF